MDSTETVIIDVSGKGNEQEVDFSVKNVDLGPVLPMAQGCTVDLTISNPGDSTVEIYSLDFDPKYQEEERILREQLGYDGFGKLLLPPRMAGEGLPHELLKTEVEKQARSRIRHKILLMKYSTCFLIEPNCFRFAPKL